MTPPALWAIMLSLRGSPPKSTCPRLAEISSPHNGRNASPRRVYCSRPCRQNETRQDATERLSAALHQSFGRLRCGINRPPQFIYFCGFSTVRNRKQKSDSHPSLSWQQASSSWHCDRFEADEPLGRPYRPISQPASCHRRNPALGSQGEGRSTIVLASASPVTGSWQAQRVSAAAERDKCQRSRSSVKPSLYRVLSSTMGISRVSCTAGSSGRQRSHGRELCINPTMGPASQKLLRPSAGRSCRLPIRKRRPLSCGFRRSNASRANRIWPAWRQRIASYRLSRSSG
jgi:hypothetical protein